MTCKDEDRVKYDIDYCANENRIHTNFCKALCCNKSIHSQCQLYENGSQCIDTHIAYCIFNGILAGSKCHQKCSVTKVHDYGQYNGNQNLQRKTVTQNLLCCLLFPFSHHNGRSWCSTIPDQRCKSGNDHNKGHTYTNTCQCQCTTVRNMPDINAVYNIIKHIDHLRCDCWNRKTQQ